MPWEEKLTALALRAFGGLSSQDAHAKVERWRQWPYDLEDRFPRTWRVCSRISFVLFECITKAVVPLITTSATTVNLDALAVTRNPERGVITVSNHCSTFDDPCMWRDMPWDWYLGDVRMLRHTLIAEDICHRRLAHSLFFGLAQGVPVVRGAGVHQPGMDYAVELLNQHRWVHVFPEGLINQSGQLRRLKWGVGRLVWDATPTPLVVPIHIGGWGKVRPLKGGVSFGHAVQVTMGEPLDLTPLVEKLQQDGVDDVTARKVITDTIQEAMQTQHDQYERSASAAA
eukprot:m.125561 g.125561  ORF g.125561 m.125561 type:complete len:285 (-) comp15748_c0_seq1:2114-2968(-)